MKNLMSFLVILPFLVGCIFGNNDNNGNNNPTNGPGLVDGSISMLDARGFTLSAVVNQSDVIAQFERKSAGIKKSFYSSVQAFEMDPSRATKCSFSSKKAGAAASAQKHLSVGRLVLGIGEEASEVQYNADEGLYYGALEKGKSWKKGVYTVTSEGSSEAVAFAGKISMPEVLENASANGSLLENGPVTVTANAPIEISFKKQAAPGEMDVMLFQLVGESKGDKLNLLCAIKENEIATTWTIPAVELKNFTADLTKGQIFVYRGNLARAESADVGRIDTEGLRLILSTVSITN